MARKRNRRKLRSPLKLLSQTSRFRRGKATGAAPGAVADIPPDAPLPKITYMHYGPDFFEQGTLDSWKKLAELKSSPRTVWIDVDGLGSADALKRLGETFQLHPLAMEDVVHVHQRAKVEDYANHLFIVARMASYEDQLNTEQMSLFLGSSFVITFQEGRPGDCFEPVRQRLRSAHGGLRHLGSDYLAYALLDAVIDGYFPIVESYGDRLNALDERLSDLEDHVPLGDIHQIRSELLLLRRALWPHREAVLHLLRENYPLVKAETRVYLRDCYDHTLQIIDVVETYREMCSDLRDFHLSTSSHRANEIMKVLTIISTIFIPLSFIAGVYGMNFRYMPELNWRFGYLYALLLMGGAAAGLVWFIWRRGWFTR
jgi:magnesium transporter